MRETRMEREKKKQARFESFIYLKYVFVLSVDVLQLCALFRHHY